MSKTLTIFRNSNSRFEDAVELLLKNGARVDVEARMCWPGHHQHNCEERGRHRSRINQSYASSDKLQCAIYYAIDGDQVKFHFLNFPCCSQLAVTVLLSLQFFSSRKNPSHVRKNLNTIAGPWYFGRVYVPLRLKNQSLYHKILLLQKFNDKWGKVFKHFIFSLYHHGGC